MEFADCNCMCLIIFFPEFSFNTIYLGINGLDEKTRVVGWDKNSMLPLTLCMNSRILSLLVLVWGSLQNTFMYRYGPS